MEAAHDPFEELTSLFLGSAPESPPVRPERAASSDPKVTEPAGGGDAGATSVTVALCGHLPVMAGLWVTQYAEKVASQHGPTGLVRLEGGRCLLEILRPDRRTVSLSEGRRPADLAEEVSRLASGSIRRWIVCVDDRDAAASVRAGADQVVILTASDKPAIVEAYRLAKSAAAKAADPGSLDLGLVLVGIDDEQAKRLSGRLGPVVSRHLDRELPVTATVRRIDVVEGSIRQMFEESARVPAEEIVETILESFSESSATQMHDGHDHRDGHDVSSDWASIQPPGHEKHRLRIATDDALEELQQPIRLSPAPVENEPAASLPDVAMAGLIEPKKPSTVPAVESHDVPADHEVLDAGIGLVELLGFVPIDWHLPNASGVECGCDSDGHLHLVARDVDVPGLHVATAWIGGQKAQFAAASGLGIESIRTPRLHVITDHPPRVADLHRSGLHLHLLAGAGDDPVLVPLNDETNRTMPG
ncbi:MAG: hypothetical protein GY895_17960 [Phycisphaera sp.]|nr:hypothetical protein [Phycisphaera sp.]